MAIFTRTTLFRNCYNPLTELSMGLSSDSYRLVSGTVKLKRVSRAKALRSIYADGVRGNEERSDRTDQDYMDILYGVHPIQAALMASRRQFDDDTTLYVRLSMYRRLYESSHSASMPSSDTDVRLPGEINRLSSIIEVANKLRIQVLPVNKSKLDRLSQYAVHQGVCLKVGKIEIPEVQTDDQLTTLFSHPSERRSGKLALLLDSIRDPMNMGGLIRTAAFLGVGPILLSPSCCPISPVVSKASVGAAENILLYKLRNVAPIVQKLVDDDWVVIGSSSQSTECSHISDLKINKDQNTILLLGSEGSGLTPELVSLCSQRVYIPPGEDVPVSLDSLNVSVAAGILMHHLKTATRSH